MTKKTIAPETQTPPNSLDMEKSILASMISAPETLEYISQIKEEYFYTISNRIIFVGIKDLYEANKPIDLVLLADHLNTKGAIDGAGGVSYISELATSIATVGNLTYYIEVVREKYLLRRQREIAQKMEVMVFDKEAKPDIITEAIEEDLFKLNTQREHKCAVHASAAISETFSIIQKLMISDGITGLSSGFPDLDDKTTGFHPGELIILAARPGMGKTALITSIALAASLEDKVEVLFCSLEMPQFQLMNRLLSANATVPNKKIREGKITPEELLKLTEAGAKIAQSKLHIYDHGSLNITQLRTEAKKINRKGKLGLIVIDYLQLMTGSGKSENRQVEISTISRNLKELAKELKLPIIALSQLSRSVEQRAGDNRPILSDLRESGSIEQDADMVLFLYRKAYYLKMSGNTDTDEFRECEYTSELIIAKQRNGDSGLSIPLTFEGEYTRFSSSSNNTMPQF